MAQVVTLAYMADDSIWHDFDRATRTLRIAFVSGDRIAVFAYRLCPLCGVTMSETSQEAGRGWLCHLCGFEYVP